MLIIVVDTQESNYYYLAYGETTDLPALSVQVGISYPAAQIMPTVQDATRHHVEAHSQAARSADGMTWMTTYPDVFGAVLFVALFLSFWLSADKD